MNNDRRLINCLTTFFLVAAFAMLAFLVDQVFFFEAPTEEAKLREAVERKNLFNSAVTSPSC